ncbi:MAG: type I-B CRISPR-associated protein Cas5b [Bacilli bacterium]
MRALKFELSGKTAFFKQPDVNTYCYYTYNCIHKIALLGIFGAILGYKGYNQQKKEDLFPEFYHQLIDFKIAICPLNANGYIPKKVQTFNNSVGYASKEEGGNLIVKEQWLENPKWNIVFLIENAVSEELAERLLQRRFVFIPYLGKNDPYALIENVIITETEPIDLEEKLKVSSLFPKKKGSIVENKGTRAIRLKSEVEWKYEERLPVELDEVCNQYRTETMVFTNKMVLLEKNLDAYKIEDQNLFFI